MECAARHRVLATIKCNWLLEIRHLAPSSRSNPIAFQAISFEPPATKIGKWASTEPARTRCSISNITSYGLPSTDTRYCADEWPSVRATCFDGTSEAVLGATLVGARVLLRERGRGGRGYDQEVYREPEMGRRRSRVHRAHRALSRRLYNKQRPNWERYVLNQQARCDILFRGIVPGSSDEKTSIGRGGRSLGRGDVRDAAMACVFRDLALRLFGQRRQRKVAGWIPMMKRTQPLSP